MRRSTFSFSILLAITTGCGSSTPEPATADAVSESKIETLANGGRLELLSAGENPRRELRLALEEMKPQRFKMEMDMLMTMQLGDAQAVSMRSPTLRMAGQLTPALAPGAQTARIEFEFQEGTAVPGQGSTPEVVEAMENMLRDFKGIRGWTVTNRRGVALETEMVVPADAPSSLRQTLEQTRDMMRDLTIPFPKDAVGAGAQWATTSKLDSNGMEFTQVATYTVSELTKEHVQMTSKIAQHAEPQAIVGKALPPGTTMSLLTMSGSGQGENRVSFNSGVPTAAGTMDTNSVMVIKRGGNETRMEIDMTVDLQMAPAP